MRIIIIIILYLSVRFFGTLYCICKVGPDFIKTIMDNSSTFFFFLRVYRNSWIYYIMHLTYKRRQDILRGSLRMGHKKRRGEIYHIFTTCRSEAQFTTPQVSFFLAFLRLLCTQRDVLLRKNRRNMQPLHIVCKAVWISSAFFSNAV